MADPRGGALPYERITFKLSPSHSAIERVSPVSWTAAEVEAMQRHGDLARRSHALAREELGFELLRAALAEFPAIR